MNGLKKLCALGALAGRNWTHVWLWPLLDPVSTINSLLPSGPSSIANQDAPPISLLLGPMQLRISIAKIARLQLRTATDGHLRNGALVRTARRNECRMSCYVSFATPGTIATSTHSAAAHSGDYLLRGRLYDFKEVSGKALIARLSFDLEMHDTKTNGTVWTYSYNFDEPVSGKDVASG